MVADVLSLLILGSLAIGTVRVWLRMRRWRAGRPSPVRPVAGMLALPRRYFVDVHHAVMRDRYAAVMHMAVAGGYIAALTLVLLVHGLQIGAPWLSWPLLAVLAVMAAGAVLVGRRRVAGPPPRLSAGAFQRLPFGLLAFTVGAFLATLRGLALWPGGIGAAWLDAATLLLVAWGCAELLIGAAAGPMKHAVYGALHLAFHPRERRFAADRPDSALQPIDLAANRLGAGVPTDFAWNRLLGFDACVQCGRCEDACPAFAAGLPLSPKKLIQDLAAAMDGRGGDAGYAGRPYPGGRPIGQSRGGADRPLIGDDAMIAPDTLWACTTCRACVRECPMMIEHVDSIIDLRRFETLEKGATPGKGAAALAELKAADTPSGRALDSRLDWAADLALPLIADTGRTRVLLWLGEGAFDLRNQRTLRALVRLLRHAGVDFAVLGAEEADCGDLARRLGDEATFQHLVRRNVTTLAKYEFEEIVTADPHALHVLANEYPAFGGHYRVRHHTSFLAGLLAAGDIRVTPPRGDGRRVTFHDPCYLGRYNGVIDAPRTLLDALGVERVEMARSGMRSSCCGGGGGAPLTDVVGERRIADVRMDHVRQAGADVVAVGCPNCAVMLEGVVQPRPAVADVAELLLQAVEAGP